MKKIEKKKNKKVEKKNQYLKQEEEYFKEALYLCTYQLCTLLEFLVKYSTENKDFKSFVHNVLSSQEAIKDRSKLYILEASVHGNAKYVKEELKKFKEENQ